jgi:uncharacterized protein YjiK
MGLKLMTLMAVGLVALAGLANVIGEAKKAGKGMRGEDILGTFERITGTGVKEPSGVAFHAGTGHLWVVGDDGTLAEIDGSGKRLRMLRVEHQLEDVAFHPPSGGLLLVSESKSELILFDPAAGRERRRWKINAAAVLGTPQTEANQGFEGLAFRPDATRPGGGIVYLAHQRAPARVVGVAFDTASGAAIDAANVVSRWTITGFEDLTAITYVPSIDRMVLVADSEDRMLVLGGDGSVEKEVPIPGLQQEGLAFDASGALWIADDKDKSVLRLHAALAGFEAHVRGASPVPAASGAPGPAEFIEKKKSELLD